MSVNAMKLNGKEIYVGQAQKKSERSAELRDYFGKLKVESADNTHGVNLYVKNLDESVNEERLQGEFGQFGTITSCKVRPATVTVLRKRRYFVNGTKLIGIVSR